MKITILSPALLCLALCGALHAANPARHPLTADDPAIFSHQVSASSGSAGAVVVGNVALAHTAQVYPLANGRLVGPGDAAKQTEQVLDNLDLILGEARSSLTRCAKLNLYVTSAAQVDAVQKVMARRFGGPVKPAVCLVETTLPVPGAVVTADAVAVSDVSAPAGEVNHYRHAAVGGPRSLSHVAVLPPGRKVFISGQAAKGATLAECTTKTLTSLEETLKYLHLTRAHIVQLKSFVAPMAGIAEVEKAFTDFFRGGTMPPLIFVEWKGSSPIEIELIASAGTPTGNEADAVDYITPPGLKSSPVYARVTQVNRGRLIYVSGLYGPTPSSPETQVREIFGKLRGLLNETGGDMKHLAKATYYVSTEAASEQLNSVRPDYYDPKRPPAASKAMVKGTAMPGTVVTFDMIGVAPKP